MNYKPITILEHVTFPYEHHSSYLSDNIAAVSPNCRHLRLQGIDKVPRPKKASHDF